MDEDKLRLKLGAMFKAKRIEKGWTIREAAEKLETKHPFILKIEQGEGLNFCTLCKACKLYGIKMTFKP